MSKTDDEAQKARAKRLREQIRKLKAPDSKEAEEEKSAPPESPRDFVQRKMRELDQKKAKR